MRRVIIGSVIAGVVATSSLGAFAAPAVGTDPVHRESDIVRASFSDIPQETAPTPGVTYTEVTVNHERDRTGHPLNNPGLNGLQLSDWCYGYDYCFAVDQVVLRQVVFDASGAVSHETLYDAADDQGPLDVRVAPDLSSAELTGNVGVTTRHYDGTTWTASDSSVQSVDITFTASSHSQAWGPALSAGRPVVDFGTGNAAGTVQVRVGDLWSRTLTGGTLDYVDQLDPSGSPS
jgi:hypothetical protein